MIPILRNLRDRIAQIEGFSPPRLARTCPTGWPAVDAALPGGGLLQGAVHEIHSPDPADGAAIGFVARIIGRFQSAIPARMALWASCRPDLFAPCAKGTDPSRLIMAKCRSSDEVLFAIEESCKNKSISVIFGDISEVDFSLSRRLQLAAADTGSTILLLRPSRFEPAPSAAATRWRAECGPGGWSLSLFRCRGGQPCYWRMQNEASPCL